MRWTKTDVVVPVRDRRQRRRILTLKNFWKVALVVVAIFVGITIEANLRHPKTTDYGRLYRNRVAQTATVSRKQEIVTEGQINDATAADPTLIGAQARAQILTGEADNPLTQTAPATPVPPPPMIGHDNAGRLVVVGGPEGVTLVQQNKAKPVLGGGFGKQ
ncbi:MAG TPA: hypothetical protein VF505_04445 [Thermoanaerobaculia bacterium]